MALEFNPFLLGSNGIIFGLYTNINNGTVGHPFITNSQSTFRIYPSTVAFPTSPIEDNTNVPGGHMAQFAQMSFGVSGSSIVLTAATNTTSTTLLAGTPSWFCFFSTSTSTTVRNKILFSNSIGTSGSGAIAIVNAASYASGATITLNSFNLRLI